MSTTTTPHTQVVGLEVARPGLVDHDRAKREAKEKVKAYQPYEVSTPYTGGKVKALLIGINYVGSQAQLSGCCNDVKTMLTMLQKIEFPIQEAAFLVDDPSVADVVDKPTRGNMIRYMAWLTDGAKAGDVLFLHYSGHGAQTKSTKDKQEAYDQCLVPSNYLDDGTILDDDLFIELVKDLPDGVRMTVVFDCCHSASMLDLPFQFVGSTTVTDEGEYQMKQTRQDNFSAGDVLLFSGCADDGTSADVTSAAGAGGAATAAFTWCVENEHGADYLEVLVKTREALSDKGFTQVPQLSCSKPLDLNKPFSLFGDLTVDEEQAKEQIPAEVQAKLTPCGCKHHCDESKIPPRFRHSLMEGYDETEVRKCFKHSHIRRDRMRRKKPHNGAAACSDCTCTPDQRKPSPASPRPPSTAKPTTTSTNAAAGVHPPQPPKLPALSSPTATASPTLKPGRRPSKPAKNSPTADSMSASVNSHALTNSNTTSPAAGDVLSTVTPWSSPTIVPMPVAKPTANNNGTKTNNNTLSVKPSTKPSTSPTPSVSSTASVPKLPTGRIPKPKVSPNATLASPLVPTPTPTRTPAATVPSSPQRASSPAASTASVPPLPSYSSGKKPDPVALPAPPKNQLTTTTTTATNNVPKLPAIGSPKPTTTTAAAAKPATATATAPAPAKKPSTGTKTTTTTSAAAAAAKPATPPKTTYPSETVAATHTSTTTTAPPAPAKKPSTAATPTATTATNNNTNAKSNTAAPRPKPSATPVVIPKLPDLSKKVFALDGSLTVHKFVKSIYGQIELEIGSVNAHLVLGAGENCPPSWLTLSELYALHRDAEDGLLYVRYTTAALPGNKSGAAAGCFKTVTSLSTRKLTAESGLAAGKVPVVVEALTAY